MLDRYARLAELAGAAPDLTGQPAWWYRGATNRPGPADTPGPAQPHPAQQRWLTHRRLRVGEPADTDGVFAATVATLGPARLAAALISLAGAAGLPAPEFPAALSGADLRLFLADLLEHVAAAPGSALFTALGLGDYPPPGTPAGPGQLPLSGLLSGLRRVGDDDPPAARFFPLLLHHLLGAAGPGLGWVGVDAAGALSGRPAQGRFTLIAVTTASGPIQFLPTWHDESSGPPPAPAPAPPDPAGLAWLSRAAPWTRGADLAYTLTAGPAPTELPLGLHPGTADGATPGQQLRASLAQLLGGAAAPLSAADLAALPGLDGESAAADGRPCWPRSPNGTGCGCSGCAATRPGTSPPTRRRARPGRRCATCTSTPAPTGGPATPRCGPTGPAWAAATPRWPPAAAPPRWGCPPAGGSTCPRPAGITTANPTRPP